MDYNYRGLNENNEWIYGYLVKKDNKLKIHNDDGYHDILEKTLSKYTFLKDKNNIPIFHGDKILKPSGTCIPHNIEIEGKKMVAYEPSPPKEYTVYSLDYAFGIGTEENHKYCGLLNNSSTTYSYELEVVGNIYL